MKSVTSFLQEVLNDLGTWCSTSTSHDLKTIVARIEHEGYSFLTITLTDFGKDFEKSLDQGHVAHDQFTGFARAGGLPRFLGGFLEQVFDRRTGRLLDSPSVTCIWAVRQLTLMFGKISLPCSPAREKRAIGAYVECEAVVREYDDRLPAEDLRRYRRISTLLWSDVFSRVDLEVYRGEIVPKHGPGATADKLRGNAKWNQHEWTERLEDVFPAGEHLIPNWRHFDSLSDLSYRDPDTERPVRVITVPKTLKTPRIIAVEPACMQYMQQGLLESLGRNLEADDLASGLIGWSSQVPNQHLACQGSRDGSLATLDLSEASDRVSNQHVRELLRNHPFLAEGVDATRSRKADVPGHGIIPLAKFASMGSALCFPFEAMVFATLIFVGIEKDLNRPVTRRDLKSYLGKVRIYGDDIIVPVEHVHSVVAQLEAFGLKVNANKSFWTGKFRESCGKDYYAGEDVTVTRMRREFPTHRTESQEIISAIAFRNQLYRAGLWNSTRWIDDLLSRLGIPMPRVVESTSPLLGRDSFLGYEVQKMHKSLHSPLVRGLKAYGTIPDSHLEGTGALQKVLAKHSELPFADARHLERAGRPPAVNTKLVWGSPF